MNEETAKTSLSRSIIEEAIDRLSRHGFVSRRFAGKHGSAAWDVRARFGAADVRLDFHERPWSIICNGSVYIPPQGSPLESDVEPLCVLEWCMPLGSAIDAGSIRIDRYWFETNGREARARMNAVVDKVVTEWAEAFATRESCKDYFDTKTHMSLQKKLAQRAVAFGNDDLVL